MPFNPKSLQNLRVISSSDQARALQKNSVEARKRNNALKQELKLTAKLYKDIMGDLPDMNPVDVMQMLMIHALQNEQYEDASRYANMIAPYKSPKLSMVEQKITDNVKDMTEEQLKALIRDEGLDSVLEEEDASLLDGETHREDDHGGSEDAGDGSHPR